MKIRISWFNIMICLLAIVMILPITGCGTLPIKMNRSWDKMSEEDMVFAKKLDDGIVSLNIEMGNRRFSTMQTANRGIILPPALYFNSIGYDVGEYAYMRQFHIMFLLMHTKGSVYDSKGDVTGRVLGNYIAFIFGRMVAEDYYKSRTLSGFNLVPIPIVGGHLYSQFFSERKGSIEKSRYEILRLPIFGPCFSFGKNCFSEEEGRRRFLWIPHDSDD